MKHLSLSALALLGAMAVNAQAQTGADACTTPDLIVGTGTFAFDNTVATTGPDGQAEALCNQLGAGTAILQDVWFTWTATATGNALLETCNITGIDTKIAVYAGATCPTPGSALACNDDNCLVGFQSNLNFGVTSGSTYVIQLGLYPGTAPVATPGAGTFSLNVLVAPSNDDCSTPIALAGPGTYTADNSGASTGAQGQTEAACLAFGFTTVVNDVWYAYTPATNGTVTITTCGVTVPSANEDSKIAVYAGVGCPTAGSALACNDDNCLTSLSGFESSLSFSAVCGTTYMIQFGMYGGSGLTDFYVGDMNITESGGTSCATPFTSYCFGDGTGTACPCANSGVAGNGCANGINPNGANLTATGNASLALDTWQLSATGVTNGPGLYFQGTTQLNAGNGNPFGDGLRCVGGSIIRLGIVTGVANASTYPSPNPPAVNAIPVSIKGLNLAGNVRNYQLWYRDSTAGFCTASVFNLTNAINITWQP